MSYEIRSIVSTLVATCVLSFAPQVQADQIFPDKMAFVPFGVNGGVSWGDKTGALVGGEVSVVRWSGILWFGGYADVLYHAGPKSLRTSVGGELGIAFFGADIGYVHDFDTGGNGFRGRGLISGPVPLPSVKIDSGPIFFSLYGGGGRLYHNDTHQSFYEAGGLIKYAFKILLPPKQCRLIWRMGCVWPGRAFVLSSSCVKMAAKDTDKQFYVLRGGLLPLCRARCAANES